MNLAGKIGCGCLIGAALVVGLAVALLVLAGRAGEAGPDRWSEIPEMAEEDRATLDAVLAAAGLSIRDFRSVGRLASLDREENRLAIAIENGRVRAFSLQGRPVAALPALSAWTALETLSLAGAGLTEVPDLSGCAALRSADLSSNRLTTVSAPSFPSGLETLDLSGNPIRDITPLVDLRLRLLDLRDCPISQLPDRLPAFPEFRVDLTGCPVAHPPGYLARWDFAQQQGGAPGTRETQSGLVQPGTFAVQGDWESVAGLSTVTLATPKEFRTVGLGPCEVEVTVGHGTLRVFLTAARETRGPWFERGFVKGTEGLFRPVAKIYADAVPGKPARLHGHLEQIGPQPYFFFVQPVGEEPVREMRYRVWRD